MGKTDEAPPPPPPERKHPHARGEDRLMILFLIERMETPPRTWGRQLTTLGGSTLCRNTPTHVGKTSDRRALPLPAQKHPHARGEDIKRYLTPTVIAETPPRTWGRRALLEGLGHGEETPPRTWGRLMIPAGEGGRLRNTPTHVGKTRRRHAASLKLWKHPHARGEDSTLSPTSRPKIETPPRTWGRLFCVQEVSFYTTKHPHARGEDRRRK